MPSPYRVPMPISCRGFLSTSLMPGWLSILVLLSVVYESKLEFAQLQSRL
jgi:hypothetical protein